MNIIRPMLLRNADYGFTLDNTWILELKYDGVRCIADTRNGVVLYTRNGVDITAQFPEVQLPEGHIFDGEIVGFDGEFHKLNWVQKRISVQGTVRIAERAKRYPVRYVAFDLLDNMHRPLYERLADLQDLMDVQPSDFDQYVSWDISPTYPAQQVEKLWTYVRNNNLEGLVAKRLTSTYVPGSRSYEWRKAKHEMPKWRERNA